MPDRPVFRLGPSERGVLVRAIRRLLETGARGGERSIVPVHDVSFAYLYGSFAEGGPFHDVDVAVWIDGASPEEAARRAFDLGAVLERAAGFPVDAVALNGMATPFRFHVYRGELLVVHDEARLTRELERTAAEYFDAEPVLRRATREAFAE